MQILPVVNRFIVKALLNSIVPNNLKRFFFRKKFINVIADLVTLRVRNRKIVFLFSTKKNAVCTQKNRLNETVLLSTQNISLILWVRKHLQFYAEHSKPVNHERVT